MSPVTELLPYDDDAAFSLADCAATVAAIVRRTPTERLREARFGEWTAVQLIAHLTDSAETFAERVRRCVEEDEPSIASFDADERMAELMRLELDPMDLSKRLQRAHGSIVQRLQAREARSRVGVHSAWGRVPASHFAAYQAKHSSEHVGELSAAFPPG